MISPFSKIFIFSRLLTFALIYSSNNFVISLQITISLCEKYFIINAFNLLIFFAEIKKTIVQLYFDISSNTFSIDIDGEIKTDSPFNFILSINNLKILPGDYEVDISSKLITQFKNKDVNVTYWIALEKISRFGV